MRIDPQRRLDVPPCLLVLFGRDRELPSPRVNDPEMVVDPCEKPVRRQAAPAFGDIGGGDEISSLEPLEENSVHLAPMGPARATEFAHACEFSYSAEAHDPMSP